MADTEFDQDATVRLSQLEQKLTRRIDAMVAEIVTQVFSIVGYDLGLLSRSTLEETIRFNVDTLVQELPAISTPNIALVERARALGEERAQQGVPLDAVLQSWMIMQRVLVDTILLETAAVGVDSVSAAIRWLGHRFAQLTGMSVDSYRRTQQDHTAQLTRMTGDLISRLTAETEPYPDDLRRLTQAIGLDSDEPYIAAAIALPQSTSHSMTERFLTLQREIILSLSRQHPERILIGSVNEHSLLLIPTFARDIREITQLLNERLDAFRDWKPVCGLSGQAQSLPFLSRACSEARTATAIALSSGRHGVIRYDCSIPEALLRNTPDVYRYLEALLAPLAHRPELLDTLETYYRSGLSIRATARTLFVHHNTVPYRLHQLESLLERDLSDVSRNLDLLLALCLRQLNGPESSVYRQAKD